MSVMASYILLLLLVSKFIQATTENNTYVKITSLLIQDTVIHASTPGSLVTCAAICNSMANCDAFTWDTNNATAKVCHILNLPVAPFTATNTADSGVSLYVAENSPLPLKTTLNGKYGEWGPDKICTDNGYVYGFRTKYDTYNGPRMGDDDCGVAGLTLFCRNDAGSILPELQVNAACNEAKWKDVVKCDTDDFMDGIQIYITYKVPGEDYSALENIKFQCYNSKVWMKSNTHDRSGQWSGKSVCPPGMRLCGMRAKVQGTNTSVADHTCINEVIGLCCFY